MEIDALDLVRALRAASGFTPTFDDSPERAERLAAAPDTLMALAEDFRFQAWVANVKAAVPDNSQCGEFKLLLHALVARAAPKGVVVDAGARERRGSNSYDLITSFGWRGVLIEAFPPRAEALRAEFGEGDYEVVQCAVGLQPGRLPLWLGAGGYVASLDPATLTAMLPDAAPQSLEIEVRTLAEIMTASAVPHDFDLLSIDIDGYDVPVLNDLIASSQYRPRYIIIEAAHGYARPNEELGFSPGFLASYREFGRTLPNVLFERIAD